MMNKNICFKLKDVLLVTEQVLVVFDIPIFFICLGSDHKRYIVLCTDSEKDTYIIIESDTQDILDMLQSKIKMIDLFYKKKTCYFVKAGEDYSSDIVEEKSSELLSPADLPKDDAYFELETPEISDYISKLSDEISSTYNYTSKFEDTVLFISPSQTYKIITWTNGLRSTDDYNKVLFSDEKVNVWEKYNKTIRFVRKDYFQPSDYSSKVVMCHA